MRAKLIIFSVFTMFMLSCYHDNTFHSISSFQGTPVWTLAKLVQSGDTVKMRKFMDSNPSVNIDELDTRFHNTLLEWAIFNGRFNSVEALLRLGADPNFISYDGESPLTYASRYLDYNCRPDTRYIDILLRFGADPNKVTKDSITGLENTALNVAASTSFEYVKCLIEKGNADPFITTEKGISPLENAVILGQLETVEYLVSNYNLSLHVRSGTYGGKRTLYNILEEIDFTSDSVRYELQQRILHLQGQGLESSDNKSPNINNKK